MVGKMSIKREQADYEMVCQDLADRIALEEESAKWSQTARFYLLSAWSLLTLATGLWVYWIRYAQPPSPFFCRAFSIVSLLPFYFNVTSAGYTMRMVLPSCAGSCTVQTDINQVVHGLLSTRHLKTQMVILAGEVFFLSLPLLLHSLLFLLSVTVFDYSYKPLRFLLRLFRKKASLRHRL